MKNPIATTARPGSSLFIEKQRIKNSETARLSLTIDIGAMIALAALWRKCAAAPQNLLVAVKYFMTTTNPHDVANANA